MDAPPVSPGASFGRYVILGVLGEGGMGVVYRARDSQLQRIVALKLLRPRDGTDAGAWRESKARLLREAQAAASLSHRAIVTVFDVGEVDGLPFLAMELVEGRTLRERIGTPPGIERADAVAWLRTVAEALGAAHAAGLVHRDIKPENVIVGHDGLARVLDFGIARTFDAVDVDQRASSSTPRLPTVTRDGAVIGTVAYMAPEQIAGESLDGRADQFAWGVLAYELLSGRVPWSGSGDSMVVLSAILTKPVTPLTEVARGLPDSIGRVVMRALAKDRDERFPTMLDLAAAWPDATGTASLGRALSLASAPLSDADLARSPPRRPSRSRASSPTRPPTRRPVRRGWRPSRTDDEPAALGPS